MKPVINAMRSLDQPLAAAVADRRALSMTQVAQLSGISEVDLEGLVDYGVLKPLTSQSEPPSFDLDCIVMLQRADLMRRDLALDSHAFALAVMLLSQITGLEAQLHEARTHLRQCRVATEPDAESE